MAAAHRVMKRMLIPILRTAQAHVFVEQPFECGRVSGVGGTHGLPNRLALLVVEFQWLNHKTIRPMFATDDISMTVSHDRFQSPFSFRGARSYRWLSVHLGVKGQEASPGRRPRAGTRPRFCDP